MKYFEDYEFACPCCGENGINNALVFSLNRARDKAGIPFKINSGYRCAEHNKKVGGIKNSSHLTGWAADISVLYNDQRARIITALIVVGFDRIGIAKTFIHADLDPNKNPERIWVY